MGVGMGVGLGERGIIIEIRHRSEWMHQVEAMTQFALHLRYNFGKHRTLE